MAGKLTVPAKLSRTVGKSVVPGGRSAGDDPIISVTLRLGPERSFPASLP